MYQINDMAFYMLHLMRIKASVNIFNVNIKRKMPPTKRILDLKDSSAVNVMLLAIKKTQNKRRRKGK